MKGIVATIVLVLAIAVSTLVIAQSSPGTGRETLAKELKAAWLPLESGLIVSSTEGTPLSDGLHPNDA